jgi:hypothetical protein
MRGSEAMLTARVRVVGIVSNVPSPRRAQAQSARRPTPLQ